MQGPPFVREGDVRRDGTFDDFGRFVKLAQVYRRLRHAGGLPCEPDDLPIDSRHLDMQLALITLTDKPYSGGQFSVDGAGRARTGRRSCSAAPTRWRASR